ncbi:hypothetical protein B0H17DRAFT_1111335 [Mycena rosella]|uniref:F-box domain-containing protein n=1 Tax=Mycena rosella TaxID=1033263 RepID=A0AAD7BMJ4_MYCRO|nr:hypothetical protein B0H17DRAFT_1111335 [Mycena rosella]
MESPCFSTPYRDLLHTSTIPSDAECQRIHELLVGPRKQVVNISDEIERLQGLIGDLTKKRDHLNAFIDAHLALVSPAPEIFTAALPSDRNATMSSAEPPCFSPIVALSTPRLWATLHIVVPFTPSKLEEMTKVVHTWLSRSGSLPLSISMVRSRTAEVDLDVSKLLETLIHFAGRWKHLHLLLHSHRSFAPLATLAADDVPLLQSLVIDGFWNREPPYALDWNIMSFTGTRGLLRLSLRQPLSPDFPVRWHQLRHLSIGHDPGHSKRVFAKAGEVLAVLRQCPDLETCNLAIQSHAPLPVQAPCQLDKLWQLCITDVYSPEFFRALVLPNLRSLEYSSASIVRDVNTLTFAPLLTSAVTSSASVSTLRLTPMLQELTIQWVVRSFGRDRDADAGIAALFTSNTPDPSTTLCPRLQVLNLLQFSAISDEALLELIRTRSGAHVDKVARLSSIRATLARRMQIDIMPSLQSLIADGLSVCLHYEPHPSSLYSPAERLLADDSDWMPISSRWGESNVA